MKVVIISSDQYTFFVDTVNLLAEKGHEVHVFCSKPVGSKKGIPKLSSQNVFFYNEFIGTISADFSKKAIIRLPLTIKEFKDKLKKIKPDVLHAFNLKWSGWIAAFSGYHPFVLSGLGSDILKMQGATKNVVLKLLRNITLKKADAITVVSKQMEKEVLEVTGSPEKISFFSHGLLVSREKNIFVRERVLNKFNLSEDDRIIFSPRYIRPIYQTRKIVKAFHYLSLQRENKNVKLLIAGTRDNHPEYYDSVVHLVDELGIKRKVVFLGRLDNYEWNTVFEISDIVVSFPYNDGLPATVFEAMYFKKPLVLSRVPSLVEILEEGRHALFCDKNSVEELARKMEMLLKDNILADKLVKNAYKIFWEKGNFEKQVGNIEQLYTKVVRNDSNN